MSFMYAAPPPPLLPPLFATTNGGASVSNQPRQGSYSNNDVNPDVIGDDTSSSSPTSVSSSIVVVIIVISSAIIVSASIYILLRFLSRRFRRTYAAAADDVVQVQNEFHVSSNSNGRHVSSSEANTIFDSLPLFTFGSVTGNITGGDCAVCLSKFEPDHQLRLLPLCCHAFHARCIDTWLSNNQTCPLCRSTVYPTDADILNKILSVTNTDQNRNGSENNSIGSGSFQIEIGSISRRRGVPNSTGEGRRSYSIGSFDYIVDEGYEVSVDSTHRRGLSDFTLDKESSVMEEPEDSLAAEVAGTRSWLRDYVDRLSSRAMSFRSSGRFFTGSSRRSDVVVPVEDLEANRIGEEISELFRWFSGV